MNTVTSPSPGDWADHKSGELDLREVARVDGDHIWLYLITKSPSGPFNAANYTFTREEAES